MFKTIIALIKMVVFMLGYQSKKRLALKYDKEGNIAERDKIVQKCVPMWARRVVEICGSTVEVEGVEKLPKDQACVFIGNHQGYMDIPVMFGFIPKAMTFVAKAELGKVPLIAPWMRLLQCTFIVRDSPRKSVEAIHAAAEGVKKGYSQVIFPEGHRSKGKRHLEFKAGSFKLAFLSESPIVPVTIDGTYKILEEKGKLNPSHVKITIHDPIPTKGLSREEQGLIPAKVQEIVMAPLDEGLRPLSSDAGKNSTAK